MRPQKISKLQTVDQGGWGTSSGSRGGGLTVVLVWLLVGFNAGVVITVLAAFGLIPLVVSDFEIRRAEGNGASEIVPAVIYVTQTPPPMFTPTATSPATESPAPTVTTVVPVTPPPTTATVKASNTPEVRITLQPTNAAATWTPIPTSTPIPPPVTYALENITFHRQGWNNCGPANLAMGLSYYNLDITQEETASFLKPDREDRNVTPEQMVEYVTRFTNLNAIWRMAGDIDIVRWLIANEFVVIVESGWDPANGEGWYGHYETVVSYNDRDSTITVYDSYLGTNSNPSVTRSYEQFDRDWQAFNRNYIVIYPPAREAELQAFLGDDWLLGSNRRKALTIAQQEATAAPDNGYAWFNLGTSFVAMGRYEEAVAAYTRAFEFSLPYRMMWYQFGPYEAFLQTGRLDEVLLLAGQTLDTTRYVEETFYYVGRVYEIRGDYTRAEENYALALDLNPNFVLARSALQRVAT